MDDGQDARRQYRYAEGMLWKQEFDIAWPIVSQENEHRSLLDCQPFVLRAPVPQPSDPAARPGLSVIL